MPLWSARSFLAMPGLYATSGSFDDLPVEEKRQQAARTPQRHERLVQPSEGLFRAVIFGLLWEDGGLTGCFSGIFLGEGKNLP
jgi:hypothetical protein